MVPVGDIILYSDLSRQVKYPPLVIGGRFILSVEDVAKETRGSFVPN